MNNDKLIKPEIIKAIIGLGNYERRYFHTRHNIGFEILDDLVEKNDSSWKSFELFDQAIVSSNKGNCLLIKPKTFMNNSGKVIPYLLKKGINTDEIIVIHDELEKPFANISLTFAGSHKGHNGLKSIISMLSLNFWRLKCGISRPENKEDVADYVLSKFDEPKDKVDKFISNASDFLQNILNN